MSLLDHGVMGDTTCWTVDARGSRLELEMRVGGLLPVRGRFTGVRGRLDVGDDLASCAVQVDVDATSLTAGSARRDAVLDRAGVLDPAAGPVITYRSRAVRAVPRGGWLVLGVLGTDRCAVPLRLEVAEPQWGPSGALLHARGEITRDEVVRLLARPGAGVLLGPVARLDLALALRPG
ncbi:YceI family protein [Pseudonocardia lacus]|uniref:YceI family protein n=1 Tax=Pseudonocardia lacus TaxID=2835865 RepID=UPI001BDD8FEB|nr:YceI family protein [Pseudonocardia lacus]